MKFDYIINNPPYSIGNEITKEIIDNINYDEFINLMPLRAYRKNNLFRYINNKIDFIISNSYAVFDAAVNVPIFSIAKDSIDISYKDFELKYCYDKLLYKFYSENSKRQACYLDHISPCGRDNFNNIDSKKDWCCGIYTPAVEQKNGVAILSGNMIDLNTFKTNPYEYSKYRYYVWNFLKPAMRVDAVFKPTNNGRDIAQTVTRFKTEKEKDNFLNWWHSAEFNGKYPKAGLSCILLRGLHKPTSCPFAIAIPNVDWTRLWTDEEILKDYGYNDDEIKEILHYNDDLISNSWKVNNNENK